MPKIASDRTAKAGKPITLLVYGLDEQNKPRAARFVCDARDHQLAKAAAAQDLEVCGATSKRLKAIAAVLPEGQAGTKDGLDVPYVEASRYRQLFDVLAAMDPSTATPRTSDETIASGLPVTWDEIGAGHLVIAQESLDYGWWEAIVVERRGDVLKLRYRDYPYLPKFSRPAAAVALLNTMQIHPTAEANQPSPGS